MGSMHQSDPFAGMSDAIKQATQIQADSITQAMKIQMQEYNASLAEVQRQYNIAQGDVKPYMDMGNTAMNALYDIMGLPNPNTDKNAIAQFYTQLNQLNGLSQGNLYSLLGSGPSNGATSNSGGYSGIGSSLPFNSTLQPISQQLGVYSQLQDAMMKGGAQGASYPTYMGQRIDPQALAFLQSMSGQTVYSGQPTASMPQGTNVMMYPAIDHSKIGVGYEPSLSGNLDAIRNDPNLLGEWNSLGLPDITQPSPQSQLDAITQNPDYQFRFQQGQGAIQNQAAAKGTLNSGATLQGLTQFGQGMAANSYAERINQLMNMVNSGQASATMSANQAMQQGENVASLDTNLGNNLASGTMAQGNVLANGLIGSKRYDILSDAYKQQQQQGMMSAGMGMFQNLLGGMGGGGGMGGMGMMGMMGLKEGGKAKANKTYLAGEPGGDIDYDGDEDDIKLYKPKRRY